MSDQPETMEVELLSGVKVTLPKEQALKEIEQRQRIKGEVRTAHEELGKIRAEKDAAAQAAAEAATKLEAEKAMKAGELEKAKQILEASTNEKLGKIERNYRKSRLESLIGSNANVIPEAAKDIADALVSSCRFDLESESLAVVGADGKPRVGQDGKPLSVDALIAEFIDQRPYLRKSTTPAGSGAAGGAGNKAVKTPTITTAEYEAAMKEPGKSQATARAIAKGELRVIDS
jgi:hypothetical protein